MQGNTVDLRALSLWLQLNRSLWDRRDKYQPINVNRLIATDFLLRLLHKLSNKKYENF